MRVPNSPSDLHAQIVFDLARAEQIGRRMDALADQMAESKYPPVDDYSDPRWFDPTRWTSCDAYPDDVSDDELNANWPGGES